MSTGGILIVAFIVIMVIAAVANRSSKSKKTHRGNSTVQFFIWFVSVARTAFCLAAAVAAKPSSDTEQGGQAASWALEPLYPPP